MRRGDTPVNMVVGRRLTTPEAQAIVEKLKADTENFTLVVTHKMPPMRGLEYLGSADVFSTVNPSWTVIVSADTSGQCFINLHDAAEKMPEELDKMLEIFSDIGWGNYEMKVFIDAEWTLKVEFGNQQEYARLKQRFPTLLRNLLMLTPAPKRLSTT